MLAGHTGYQSACQVCSHSPLVTVFALGHQAPVHAHVTKENLHESEVRYPLNLCRCTNCGLLQLDYIVPPEVLFYKEYPYFTGMTTMLVQNFRTLRDIVMERYGVGPEHLAVDIGSNDGSLLQGFKEKGVRVLGVEPTNVALVAQEKGIPTLQEFFTEKTAADILEKYGKAKVVTATNMFAHINNPFELARGIGAFLADDGVFISESQYLGDMVEKTALDTIYHEHLRYYSLKPIQTLLSIVGLTVVDAERIEAAGGSIRVYAMKGKHAMSERAQELLRTEEKNGLHDGSAFTDLANRVLTAKQRLLGLLLEAKKQGRIVGIGAPGRSNTLLQFMNIDTSFIDYAVEKAGSPKIGLFTPGTHIPIVDEQILYTDQPEYGLLLSWHIADELVKKLRERGYRGKFIVPLPEPRII